MTQEADVVKNIEKELIQELKENYIKSSRKFEKISLSEKQIARILKRSNIADRFVVEALSDCTTTTTNFSITEDQYCDEDLQRVSLNQKDWDIIHGLFNNRTWVENFTKDLDNFIENFPVVKIAQRWAVQITSMEVKIGGPVVDVTDFNTVMRYRIKFDLAIYAE
jgi:predicted aldo/keto reductase-like oxidoreductase